MSGRIQKKLGALLSACVVFLMFAVPTPVALSASLTVNSTGDASDLVNGDGICFTGFTNADLNPECTLRAAIEEANASVGADTIAFDIPATDPGHSTSPLSYRILPGSALPSITGTTHINGSSQPDHPGTPIVVIDGSSAGAADGIFLAADNSSINGVVVVSFEDEGIEIIGDDNTVTGSYVGVASDGVSAAGNDDGILIRGNNNTVGGAGAQYRVVISGNADEGVSLDGGSGNVVINTYIGTNSAGTTAIGNAGNGVAAQFGAAGNTIGPGAVISGNGLSGVLIDGSGSDNTVIVESIIGLDAGGTAALGNANHGVLIRDSATGSRIGGFGQGNVISANAAVGIYIEPGAGDNTIQGNLIGTDATGLLDRGNGAEGAYVDADDATIVGNIVSGNGSDGLRIERYNAIIKGNRIGTDANGGALGNDDDGIDTGSGTVGSQIGGTGANDGNVIAYNADRGISLRHHTGTTAAILGNSIHDNGSLGIDLRDDGVTPNDLFDNDSLPPNELLNHPHLISAEETAGTVEVLFLLDVPAGWYRIEFFANPSGIDPTGFGEGETLVGSKDVGHAGSGPWLYSFSYPGSDSDVITATTTRCTSVSCSSHDISSEFSRAESVIHINSSPTLSPIGDRTVDEETPLAFTTTANDPDTGDTLTFTLEDGSSGSVPTGASITTGGDFTWTPTEAQGPGSYTFDIVVTDNGTPNRRDRETITVTVNEVNIAPVLSPIGNQTGHEQAQITFNANASDGDTPANGLTYHLEPGTGQIPLGAFMNPATGVFRWTPTEAQGPGSYTFDIVVTDNGTPNRRDRETITVTVYETNRTPVLTNPGAQTGTEQDSVRLALDATDPDRPANTLSWSATGLPPGLHINTSTGEITGTLKYSAGAHSPYQVIVTVTDNGSPTRFDLVTFTWNVIEKNRPPTLDVVPDRVTDELVVVKFTARAHDPDPADTLTFSMKDGPGAVPSGALLDPQTGEFYWVPGEGQGPGTYTFNLVVTDDGNPNLKAHRTVTIEVKEVPDPNQSPEASDDRAQVEEDRSIVIDATANDTDPENDSFEITSVSQPDSGRTDLTADGQIRYTPPADFNGWASFSYRVSDDVGGTSTATVIVKVLPVNDAPEASNDDYELFTYDEAPLGVLANDTDVDGDRLEITIRSGPDSGTVRTDGTRLYFTPDIGWYGTETFTYMASDPDGAGSEATVEVSLSREALADASRLAEDLGVNDVPFDPPNPLDSIPTSLLTVEGMSLLADAFFQTVSALRLPLSFLGLAVVMLVGFGSATRLPVLLFGTRKKHWAVVLRNRQQPLPVLTEPAGDSVIYNLDPTTSGVTSVGKARTERNKLWLPIDTPNGTGWVDREFLTEQVDLETFKEDIRPTRLVNQLARRLRAGDNIDSLISRRGLILALTGSPTRIPPDQLASLFGDTHVRHLFNIEGILDNRDDVLVAVTRPFLEAFEATQVVTAETPHSKTSLIPTECWNFPYLALGVGSGVQPWLVFFEYKAGKAWIAGLGVDE